MSDAQPNAVCQCGYPLLPGQDCPECGRAYAVAIRAHREPRGYWWFTVTGMASFVAGLALVLGTQRMHGRDDLLGVAVVIGVLLDLLWFASFTGAFVGFTLGFLAWSVSHRRRLVIITLVANASLLGFCAFAALWVMLT